MSHDFTNHPRWWITGPEPDESLRSLIERAVNLYGSEGNDYRPHLSRHATPYGVSLDGLDTLSVHDVLAVARTVGVRPRDLFMHRLTDHPALLEEHERRAFCPRCWQNDMHQGRPPTFRRAWSGIFTLQCAIHAVPLHWAPNLPAGEVPLSILRLTPATKVGKETLTLIHGFARRLGDALYDHAPWPPSWRGSAFSARALLMRSTTNLGCLPEHLPLSSISADPDLREFVGVPLHRNDPLQASPWEGVRRLGPPAWRRAAFWMVAWYVIPQLAMTFRPPGLPIAPFEAIDDQWSVQPPRRDMRRLQKYRRALIDMSRVFPVSRGVRSERD
jgi:hypothetical protein